MLALHEESGLGGVGEEVQVPLPGQGEAEGDEPRHPFVGYAGAQTDRRAEAVPHGCDRKAGEPRGQGFDGDESVLNLAHPAVVHAFAGAGAPEVETQDRMFRLLGQPQGDAVEGLVVQGPAEERMRVEEDSCSPRRGGVSQAESGLEGADRTGEGQQLFAGSGHGSRPGTGGVAE